MKAIADIISVIIFFIVFKFFGIYIATAVAMIVSVLQLAITWFYTRKIDKTILFSLVVILLLGGATLITHNPRFIEWKPSIIYWFFAIIIFYTQYFTKKTVMQSLFEKQLLLPVKIYRRLNLIWGIFFFILGFINLYVAYHYSQNAWVNFKLFGVLGLIIAMMFAQGFYLSKQAKHHE